MIKLNIGCGNDKKEGYINIDTIQTGIADIICEAWQLIKFQDNSVDEVFSSHMIEHLTEPNISLTLKEWHRVLKTDGKLIIRCPNFPLYIKEYLYSQESYRNDWGLRNIFGWQDRGEGMLHRTGFSTERFRNLLPEYRFRIDKIETIPTRQTKGIEHRPDGDILCQATKF